MIGKTISHYKILQELGEGGMGVVYKAEDTKLRRTVALKFLASQAIGGEEDKARFIHEAQAAASLSHPNICTVHEIDEADGRSFISMEYIEGASLKEKIATGPLKLDEAVSLAIQVAEGLHEAHEKGIVHRDVKPANVMITAKGRAKITDFGLAKSARGLAVTQTGTTLGTIAYMSPEQTRGEVVDGRTDIWSLGAMLYEMVTGLRPFKGDYEPAVVYSIQNEKPEPPTALRTGVPMELEMAIARCLEKRADDRYQTAGDLVSDLRRLQRGMAGTGGEPAALSGHAWERQPGGVDHPSARAPSRSSVATPPRRPRGWLLAVALIVLAAIALIVFRPYFATPRKETQEEPRERPHAEREMIVVLPFGNLGPPERAYFADGMTEEITSRLASVKALGVISRTTATQYDRAGKTLKEIGVDLGVDYVLEGTVRWDGAVAGGSRVRVTPQLIRASDDTHVWSDVYERKLEDIFSVQSDIAEKVVEQLGVTLLDSERGAIRVRPTENLEAYNAYLRGMELAASLDWLREDLELGEQMFERALEIDPRFALAAAELSITHSKMYWGGLDHTAERIAEAKAWAQRALEIQPDLPEGHLAMGYYYYYGHLQYEEALREFDIALEGRPNDARVLEAIAYVKRRQGHFEEAANLLKKVLELSPRDANVAAEIGYTYTTMRRYAGAQRYFERSISIAPDQDIAYTFKAANFWLWKGDLPAARAVLEKMPVVDLQYTLPIWYEQELLERDYEAALERLSESRGDLREMVFIYSPPPLLAARTYDFMGKPESAHAMYDSSRVLLEQLMESGFDDHSIHVCLGMAYAGLGRVDDAVREGELAVQLYPVSVDASGGTFAIMGLAEIYVMVGDYDAAIDRLDYLLSIPSEVSVPLLRLEPRWDPLRDEPRFQHLLERYSKTDS
jgi:TolB-like protein/Tfp pilus assembly protein PilF/predicted Ser/Thr protein kinase